EIFMIIVMGAGAARKEIRTVIARIKALGYTPHPIFGKERTVLGAIGDEGGAPRAGRRSVQAAHLPVRLPGTGAQGPQDPAQGGGSRGDADRDRGDEPRGRGAGRAILG